MTYILFCIRTNIHPILVDKQTGDVRTWKTEEKEYRREERRKNRYEKSIEQWKRTMEREEKGGLYMPHTTRIQIRVPSKIYQELGIFV